uniref:Uncharacterized protein n=1 Tax=Magallana gigas TaxID=29159 RepID=A0A8W8M6L3_MAGGI|nr:uncharacterized protein LOC105320128 [Crassostrea gigas]|eukprot:XP_011416235.1 PREDICTED: uncharacterized protein LOC105320128 [Crassostrea gigas]
MAAMSELNADFRDGNNVTIVTLSKTIEQQNGPLMGVNFANHVGAITMNSTITATCVSVRLPFNGELYGFDVNIPDGHQIDVNGTVITPGIDEIEIKIVKIGSFTLP